MIFGSSISLLVLAIMLYARRDRTIGENWLLYLFSGISFLILIFGIYILYISIKVGLQIGSQMLGIYNNPAQMGGMSGIGAIPLQGIGGQGLKGTDQTALTSGNNAALISALLKSGAV